MPRNQLRQATSASDAELTPAQRMGKRLREARLRLNKTQGAIAGDQFSVSYVSAIERGQIRPSLGALEQLADALETPVSELVDDRCASDAVALDGGLDAAERHQEEAEAMMRVAQVQIYQGKLNKALDTLRSINATRLAGWSALELRRLRATCFIEMNRPQDACKEALEGVTLAERTGDEEMRARLRNELGDAYLLERKTQWALEQFRLAYEALLHGMICDPAFRLRVLYNLGATYWLLNQPLEAIGYLREAVELTEDINNSERLGDALLDLSIAYTAQGDMRKTKIYAQRALATYDLANNHRLTVRAYTRLGHVTAQSSQVDEALGLLRQAQAMTEREDDLRGRAEVQRSLAAVYVSQKRLPEAKAAAQKALDLAQSVNDDILLAESQLAMAQVQDAQGKAKEAEAGFEQAIALLEKTGARQHLGDAYAAFSSFLEARGQSQRALEVLKKAWNI